MKALLDTNIIIDFIERREQALKFFQTIDFDLISIVNWIEVLSNRKKDFDVEATKDFLSQFECAFVSYSIAERASSLRREKKMSTPDAIIYATALEYGYTLVTRNTKHFKEDWPSIHVPYKI